MRPPLPPRRCVVTRAPGCSILPHRLVGVNVDALGHECSKATGRALLAGDADGNCWIAASARGCKAGTAWQVGGGWVCCEAGPSHPKRFRQYSRGAGYYRMDDARSVPQKRRAGTR